MTVSSTGIWTAVGGYCAYNRERLWEVTRATGGAMTNATGNATVVTGTPRVRVGALSGLDCSGTPAWLSEPERERWRGLGEARKACFLGSRILMRELLADELGDEPQAWLLDSRGRPLKASDAERVRTTISHNRAHAAVALCLGAGGVGIDLEMPHPRCRWRDIAKRWYSPAEQALLAGCDPQHGERLFYRLWTLKEAWVKATERGLAGNFQAIRACHDKDAGWQLESDAPADGWQAWSGWVGQECLAIIWRGDPSGKPRIESSPVGLMGSCSAAAPLAAVDAMQFEIRPARSPHPSPQEQL